MKKGEKIMEQLKQLRMAENLSQKEFAKKLDVSTSLYAMIEKGYRKPSRNFLEKLKKEYKMFDTNIFFTQ